MCETDNLVEQTAFLKPGRLHPAGMLFSFLKFIKETILGLGIGTFAIFKQSPKYGLLFVGVFALFLIINSILSWYRFTYRIEDGELRIEQGIFIRKKRFISLNRIHKIDLTANVIHRVFKLVKVQIDTASSGDGAEVSLSAIKTKDAHALRQALKGSQEQHSTMTTTMKKEQTSFQRHPTKKMPWRRLFIAGSTSGSIGVMLLTMLIIYSQIGQFIPENVYNQTFEWVIHLSVIFMVVLTVVALIALWFIGIAGTMLKYGNFTIEKRAKELFIKRGLLETKELTIPFDRIQAIEVKQSIIRQPLKYVQVSAIIAGGSFDSSEAFPVIFPLMRREEVNNFLEEFVPGYQEVQTDVIPLARKGRKYYLFSAVFFFLLALIPVVYFFPSYSWIPGVLIVISAAYGLFAFKETGYHINGKRITFHYRSIWNKTTMMTYHRRIQTIEKKRHKLQQVEGLATVQISLIGQSGLGTHFGIRHVTDEDANQMANWFSYRQDVLD